MNKLTFVSNPTTGVMLAILTAVLWSSVPIALKASLSTLDGITITWFRFTIAAIICFLWQFNRGNLTEFVRLSFRDWIYLTLAGFFLIADYVGYTMALNYISPITVTIFSQIMPFFLCLGGIIVFKERLNLIQSLGFVSLLIGLILFFDDSMTVAIANQSMLIVGAMIAILSALIWVFYALLQKVLLKRLSATNILLFVYLLAIILLGPLSNMNGFTKLDGIDWSILFYCAFNTLIAYGAFAQSMKHIDTTKVSSIIATIPLLTIALSYLGYIIWPEHMTFDSINFLGWLGIVLVVVSVIAVNSFTKTNRS